MIRFRTELDINPTHFKLNHQDEVLLIGSCFTENIGDRLKRAKFKALQNPFGTLYNPISISQLLSQSFNSEYDHQVEFDKINKIYFDYNYHGQLSALTREAHINKVKSSHKQSKDWALKASCLIISLGSSFVHYLRSDGRIVANCHKQKADLFDKRLLSEQEIINALELMLDSLKSNNPNVKLVITISPVRHLADGLIGNNLSKARLTAALHEFLQNQNEISYFPSYELLLDDLRDYRYYDKDLVHPNELAIEYLWSKFAVSYFTPETISLISMIESISKALEHRPYFQESTRHIEFLLKTKERIKELQTSCPSLDFEQELDTIEDQLK